MPCLLHKHMQMPVVLVSQPHGRCGLLSATGTPLFHSPAFLPLPFRRNPPGSCYNRPPPPPLFLFCVNRALLLHPSLPPPLLLFSFSSIGTMSSPAVAAATTVSRTDILRLYRSLLSAGRGFADYNFRAHARRRVAEEFRVKRYVYARWMLSFFLRPHCCCVWKRAVWGGVRRRGCKF